MKRLKFILNRITIIFLFSSKNFVTVSAAFNFTVQAGDKMTYNLPKKAYNAFIPG